MIENSSTTWNEAPQLDNLIETIEDGGEAGSLAVGRGRTTWKILVVDDDADTHASTRLALRNITVLGRELELIGASSLHEAQDALLNSDFAVILLDVVMEDHDSGLRLAQWVREAGLSEVRIILRTGQPGYAPEMTVIQDYDINDYRAKSELTRAGLITSLTAAIRSFQQIETSERNRRGLEMILSRCSSLFQNRNLAGFAHGVLAHASTMCNASGDALLCLLPPGHKLSEARVVSGLGALAIHLGQRVGDLPEGNDLKARLMDGRSPATCDNTLVLAFDTSCDHRFLAALKPSHPLDAIDTALLQVFVSSITPGFEAVLGHRPIEAR